MELREMLEDRRVAAGLVALVAGLVYANSLANGYAYDDFHIVVTNTAIHDLSTLPDALVRPYWPTLYGRELGLWRPVTTALLGLQWVVGDGAPIVFHVVNVLGHVAASVLALLVMAQLLPAGAALAGGLLFAVHPVHVEAVANVIGLSEIVSAIALLGAALVHLRSGPVSGWGSALLVGGLYALGFGAKESAVTLPGIVFLLDAARGRLGVSDVGVYLRARWRVYLVMLVVAGALLQGRWLVLGSVASPFAPLGADLLEEVPRIWTLAEVWTHYVRLWVFPLDLASDYSPDVIPISIGWHASNTAGLLLALVILLAAIVAWRRPSLQPDRLSGRAAAFGVVWFVITISPVSNTVFLSGVLLAERTLYLPSVGLAAATGWLVARLARERPALAPAVLALALGLATVRTWQRNPTWLDNPTALGTLIEEHPQSGRSQWILGDAFLRQGRVSEALRTYRAAINILGGHYQLVTEIAQQLMTVDRYPAAEQLLRFAADNEPQFPLAFSLLAIIRAELGDPEDAERFARMSLARYDSDPARYYVLAWALAAQGRVGEARSAAASADERGGADTWHRQLYRAYAARAEGDSVEARIRADSALAGVGTPFGRRLVDSVRVAEFGLPAATDSADVAVPAINR